MTKLHEGLVSLGVSADNNRDLYEQVMRGDADPAALLERFPSPGNNAEINPLGVGLKLCLDIKVPEFTSLCPMTGQPDFATIVLHYVPAEWCVESKALKLYMLGYRNRRDFHESCVVKMCNDLVTLLEPKWLQVTGEFTPRGGIPFWPTATYDRDAE